VGFGGDIVKEVIALKGYVTEPGTFLEKKATG
jgi:hypothetical protein